MQSPTGLTVIYMFLYVCGNSNVTGLLRVTASAVTGIPDQQALTLRCNYTISSDDAVTGFRWSRKSENTYTQILSGSVTPQTAIFLETWLNKGVFRGDYISTLDIELPANHVTSSYAGTYRCTVIGISSPGMGDVTALILYSPIISGFPSTFQVIEFSRLQIDCIRYTTVGNPSTTSYTWTYGGSTVTSVAVLDIRSINRSQAGQYICTATNTQGSDSAPVSVDVQYDPTVSGIPSTYQVTESSHLQVDCSRYTIAGNPSATSYTWTYKGSTVSSGAVLDIRSISRSQAGQYTCTATNTLTPTGVSQQQGTATGQFQVDVQYLDRPMLTLDKVEVVENDTVKLNCSVVSNPTVQMTIKNIDNDTVVVQGNTNTLSYTIQRVQCLHNGMFVCSADNQKTGTVYTSSKHLNVLCSPRQDNRQAYVEVITRGLGEVASFVANVVSNPIPSFNWFQYIDNQFIPIPNSTIHVVITSDRQSFLQISVSHNRDYGRYAAIVDNYLGRLQIFFTLSPVSPPRSPDEMTVDSTTTSTVSIRWKSNDNGGSEQTFNVEYQTVENDWRLWKEGIFDPGKGKWLNTVIRNLIPDTQYNVQVYSKNRYGKSDKVVREAKTQMFTVQTSDRRGEGIGIGVGIGIAVLVPFIIGLIIALVISVRRRSPKKQGDTIIRDNVLQLTHLEGQDSPSTYADLKRDNQTTNEYEKIHAPNESSGSTTVYQNVPPGSAAQI